jgi:hypothetical protein
MRLYFDEERMGAGGVGAMRMKIERVWRELEETLSDSIMFECPGKSLKGRKVAPCLLEVRASKGTPLSTICAVGNAFLEVVDVEIFHPESGAMLWRQAGDTGNKFEANSWEG